MVSTVQERVTHCPAGQQDPEARLFSSSCTPEGVICKDTDCAGLGFILSATPSHPLTGLMFCSSSLLCLLFPPPPHTHTMPPSVLQVSESLLPPPHYSNLTLLSYRARRLDIVVLLVLLLCLVWRGKPGPHSILHGVGPSAWAPILPGPRHPDPALWAAAVPAAAGDVFLGTVGTLFPQLWHRSSLPLGILPLSTDQRGLRV